MVSLIKGWHHGVIVPGYSRGGDVGKVEKYNGVIVCGYAEIGEAYKSGRQDPIGAEKLRSIDVEKKVKYTQRKKYLTRQYFSGMHHSWFGHFRQRSRVHGIHVHSTVQRELFISQYSNRFYSITFLALDFIYKEK